MKIITILASLLLVQTAAAQPSASDLAKPPATALRFTIMSTAGKHGESARWTTADGMRMGRESMVLRGQVFEVDSEADEPALQKIQDEALAGRSPALVKSLLKIPPGPVAFTHVRAFLAGDHFAEDQTVVVDKGVIAQAGAATEIRVPSGATSQEEALAIVRKAKADGFIAIKLYGTFNPAWVKATAAEAHRLGLHVHGHLPAGMRPSQAIDDGYDEITHIYFVMMQAMPDSIVSKSNGMARFMGPGRYAKDVRLDAEPMKSLIAKMAQRQITVDPTLVVAESLYVPENGDLSKRIGDLRHTRIVMMDGNLMDANALRAAGGFLGRPAYAD